MQLFTRFMKSIEDDHRIGATHISVYMVLLYLQENTTNSFPIKRNQVMWRAKIHSRHTYNTCMKQLHEYGYIIYQPTCNPAADSRVSLVAG